MVPKHRNWMITSYELEGKIDTEHKQFKYLVGQIERCPSTGRPHRQMYLEMENPISLGAVKKLIGDQSAHCEPRQGTQEGARNYCMKADTRLLGPFEYGTWKPSEKGKRSDLEVVATMVKEGKSAKEICIAETGTYIRYHRGIEKAVALMMEPEVEFRPIEVVCYWGPAGTGKSHKARMENPGAYKHDGNNWFDGYRGQKVAIFDEFRGQVDLELMKKITDKWMCQVPIKGAMIPWLAEKIIIISNYAPEDWYGGDDALLRRIQRTIYFDTKYTDRKVGPGPEVNP